KAESTRTAKTYLTEPVSVAPAVANIAVANNKAGVDDTITVTNLIEGDVVNVYSAATAGTLLGTATVEEGETTATVSLAQLGVAKGSVYVSVKSVDKLVSTRTAAAYDTELTAPVLAANIAVLNNDGEDDIVRVTGLAEGDVVNIYDSATGGTLLGTATVANGKTSINVKITQLSVGAGKVYVTITKGQKQESTRVVKDYIAE
ncbi:IMP dehydrogenase, partial [Paenibacillus sp. YIM B09110]|uniref:IMP dehydrogenase n=1 Tax=Paenibacillus sp. YIM B09110 TaxID=3126102 RepID=UPI00301E062F